MGLKIYVNTYDHMGALKSTFPTSYKDAIINSAREIQFQENGHNSSLEEQLKGTQAIMANLIEFLVDKGLMDNEEFCSIIEQEYHRPCYRLILRSE